jgi:hypothetical protein
MTNDKPTSETLQEALRKLNADLTNLAVGIEELRRQRLETARETYEFAVENYHGERGYQRIQDFADANGITFREAMLAIGNEIHPKAPKPSEPPRPVLTEARLETHMAETGLSYRDAMTELAGLGFEDVSDEEDSSAEPAAMTEAEEKEQFGVTHNEITAYAQQNKLPYREAMIELSARSATKEER